MAKLRRPTNGITNASTHVIFIHGLNGDNFNAWQSSGTPKEFWPDWLQADIPDLAVWSLGYPASASKWLGGTGMALPDRAANVLPCLLDEPPLKTGNIVFVAYSLGGLVLKDTLRLAVQSARLDPDADGLLKRTKRIVFIGTPHLGSDQASLINWLPFLTRPFATVSDLSRNSPYLRSLSSWFKAHVHDSQIDILALLETKRMPLFGIRGLGGIVVKPDSGDPALDPRTKVIPLDEDHDSIRSPRDREAELYTLVRAFIAKPIRKAELQLLSPAFQQSWQITQNRITLESVKEQVDLAVTELALSQSKLLSGLPLALNNAVVDDEAERRLSEIRQVRYLVDADVTRHCSLLFEELTTGSLLGCSNRVKRKVLSWLARLCAPSKPNQSEALLRAANDLGQGEENDIAAAFLAFHRDRDFAGALAILARHATPLSRSAAFIIVATQQTPEASLQWLASTGLSISDLDGDGKLRAVSQMVSADRWDDAFVGLTEIRAEDFEQTPALLLVAAQVKLAQSVHPEIRHAFGSLLPENLADFPLGNDPASLEHREAAKKLFNQAAAALRALGQVNAADHASDYWLWLHLRNPDTYSEALSILSDSMADQRARLRRLPMAIDFKLNLDLAAAEQEVDRASALSGGRSREVSIARYTLARNQPSAESFAAYLSRHRSELSYLYDEAYLSWVEIQMLAQSGQLARARELLDALDHKALPADSLVRLERLIREAQGSDPVEEREALFKASGSLTDLINLVELLNSKKAFSKLAHYGELLFRETRSAQYAEIYVRALLEEGGEMRIVALFEEHPELRKHSDNLLAMLAWANYRIGDLNVAKSLVTDLIVRDDKPNYRDLQVNIAITSGDWRSLATYVENEWLNRAQRSAEELLRAGQLAQHISHDRSQELITAAAELGYDDPNIMLGCYASATSGGWEADPRVHLWLERAAAISGEDGPVKRVALSELTEIQASWREVQDRAWSTLLSAKVPMFVAAHTLNRSLLELHLVAGLANVEQSDVRRRTLLFSFSGARPPIVFDRGRIALDVTSIFNLASLGRLSDVLSRFECSIAHSTLSWLFGEMHRLQFHQPSRVRKATDLKELIEGGHVFVWQEVASEYALSSQVGNQLASFLTAARNTEDAKQRVAVSPYPIYKQDSLLASEADVSDYEDHLAGCLDVVAALRTAGQLTAQEEIQAKSVLSLSERAWPKPTTIKAGATLYLDDVSVSHLQNANLLKKLKSAGFKVFVSVLVAEDANKLIEHEAQGGEAKRLIEEVRAILADGIQKGTVQLCPLIGHDGEDAAQILDHPTSRILAAAPMVDAVVIDDRFHNSHANIEWRGHTCNVVTSLDLLTTLKSRGEITDLQFSDSLAYMRRAGHALVPVTESELLSCLAAAPVENGEIGETAELRAIRESVLQIQMTDLLQIPVENIWFETMFRSLINALQKQWSETVTDAHSRARSNWLLSLLDLRRWSHSLPHSAVETMSRYSALLMLLTTLPNATDPTKERYWQWLEEAVLSPVREDDPQNYTRLKESVERLLNNGVRDLAHASE